MCEIETDKTIQNHCGASPKYPFELLDVGDSFVIQGKNSADISGSMNYWNAKLAPRKFKGSVRDEDGERVTKNGKDGIRVMRVK